jgi:uncharacterized protein
LSDRSIDQLHDEIESVARHPHVLHEARTQCKRGCAGCCVDGLTVFEIEAAPIRRVFAALLATGVPHAVGACAFLDEHGGCRVYQERPYVCRTQGLPLRWLAAESDADAEGNEDADIVEHRDICPLNEAGEPIEELEASACFTLGPFEERLARLDLAAGNAPRMALRALFAGGPA